MGQGGVLLQLLPDDRARLRHRHPPELRQRVGDSDGGHGFQRHRAGVGAGQFLDRPQAAELAVVDHRLRCCDTVGADGGALSGNAVSAAGGVDSRGDHGLGAGVAITEGAAWSAGASFLIGLPVLRASVHIPRRPGEGRGPAT